MKSRESLTTVGALIKHLSSYDSDTEVDFSGLDFYRVKRRGPNLVQVEFSQQVYRDENGKVVVESFD